MWVQRVRGKGKKLHRNSLGGRLVSFKGLGRARADRQTPRNQAIHRGRELKKNTKKPNTAVVGDQNPGAEIRGDKQGREQKTDLGVFRRKGKGAEGKELKQPIIRGDQ